MRRYYKLIHNYIRIVCYIVTTSVVFDRKAIEAYWADVTRWERAETLVGKGRPSRKLRLVDFLSIYHHRTTRLFPAERIVPLFTHISGWTSWGATASHLMARPSPPPAAALARLLVTVVLPNSDIWWTLPCACAHPLLHWTTVRWGGYFAWSHRHFLFGSPPNTIGFKIFRLISSAPCLKWVHRPSIKKLLDWLDKRSLSLI